MGFTKRYITRERIDYYKNDFHWIIKLQNADALIIDEWSDSFYKNFNFKYKDYQNKRNEIISSGLSIKNIKSHEYFKDLLSLSNIYINLNYDGNLIDALLACSIFDLDFFSFKNLDELKLKFNEIIDKSYN